MAEEGCGVYVGEGAWLEAVTVQGSRYHARSILLSRECGIGIPTPRGAPEIPP